MQESLEHASRLVADRAQLKASATPKLGANSSPLEAAIANAVRFLEGAFNIAGCWSDFLGVASGGRDWITAYVAWSLLQSRMASRDVIRKAGEVLEKDRYPSGVWGYRPGLPVDMDSSSWATLFLCDSRYPLDLRQTVQAILAHQDSTTGGFRTYLSPEAGIRQYVNADLAADLSGWCDPHLCVTCAVVQALCAFGLAEEAAPIRAALTFIRHHQTQLGYWDSYWYHGRTYGIAQAIRVLSRTRDASDGARLLRASSWLRDTQRTEGSWDDGIHHEAGRVIDTALAIRTQLDLAAPPRARLDRAIDWLIQQQRADGSWNSTPILQLPAANDHTPWEHPDLPEWGANLKQGICLSDRNRFFTTATVLQALAAWEKYLDA